MTARESLILTPAPATTPEVGVLLAVLHEARVRTLNTAARINDLDTVKAGHHSAGTLLYHIALIELDWLYADVLEKSEEDFPAEARAWFPLDARDDDGRLSVVTGEPLERHLARLNWVRGLLDGVFRAMTLEEFRRPRVREEYDVTPEWVLMHLALHEAQHRGQLAVLV
ncbi:DinB family protein [Deinococcus sp.]|uniref:DinB family protein n=1 Tax=Deinococcus sp. TaxID=47478 RepID=UPI003C7BF046